MTAALAPNSPAGWYPEPDDATQMRWWSGTEWVGQPTARTPFIAAPLGTPAPKPAAKPVRPKTVGVTAFIVALVLLVGSTVASVLIGLSAGPIAGPNGAGFMLTAGTNTASPELMSIVLGTLIQGAIGLLFGLWALIQGIVATATKRGRAYGVFAMVLTVLTPILSMVSFSTAMAIAAQQR